MLGFSGLFRFSGSLRFSSVIIVATSDLESGITKGLNKVMPGALVQIMAKST